MTKQHPIAPPPELVQEWMDAPHGLGLGCHPARSVPDETYAKRLVEAAQWGADMELEACCRELEYNFMPDSGSLRAARRPKPPSLKQQALKRKETSMDKACVIIQELMALAGIGDKGWTDAEQQRLGKVAEQARSYLEQTDPQQPIPIGERLPRPEDCDKQGLCWLWERDCGYNGRKWALEDRAWSLSQSDEDLSVYTHWLPHHALPMPQQEVQ